MLLYIVTCSSPIHDSKPKRPHICLRKLVCLPIHLFTTAQNTNLLLRIFQQGRTGPAPGGFPQPTFNGVFFRSFCCCRRTTLPQTPALPSPLAPAAPSPTLEAARPGLASWTRITSAYVQSRAAPIPTGEWGIGRRAQKEGKGRAAC